jgi:hypothetical protein
VFSSTSAKTKGFWTVYKALKYTDVLERLYKYIFIHESGSGAFTLSSHFETNMMISLNY